MKNSIIIQALVDASLEKAWECYTQSEHITNWNFASEEWCCPSASVDLKNGGKYTARMEAKDGSMGFDFGYTYEEVVPKELLKMTMDDNRKMEVSFVGSEGGVGVIVEFEAEGENSMELQEQGWQAILDNYKHYTESI